jgi:hypothetical protein
MTDCVHCGLPATADCASHVQNVPRRVKRVVTKARQPGDEQSIHPRVRNGRTVHPKVNTKRAK